MKTASRAEDLVHPDTAAATLGRLAALTPQSRRRWGQMTAQQMVCHLSDSFRVALGDRPTRPIGSVLHRTVVRWVALHTPIRWPRGAMTLPEADQEAGGTPPTAFARDRAELQVLIGRFAAAGSALEGVQHPLFGRMSAREWGRWGYRHTDHHLRQFGV